MTAAVEEEIENEAETSPTYEFDENFQNKLTALVLRDSRFLGQAKDVIDPNYFVNDANKALVRIVKEHYEVHKAVPDIRILPQLIKDARAAKRIRDDMVADVKSLLVGSLKADLSNSTYIQAKVTEFARHQAMEEAILKSALLLEKGDFDQIDKVMKKALAVGMVEDGEDYDYFGEIDNRTQHREDMKAGKVTKNGISSGFSTIDAYLYHNGWGRREMSLIMGAAKAGKSLSLGEFAKNAVMMGYNACYVSCEVHKEIIADRIDANLADMAIKMLKDDPQEIMRRIKAAEAKAGKFKIRDFASNSLKPSKLQRMIEEYRGDGLIFDLMVVDYADIMAAEYRSDNIIDNMRSIYLDLRKLAHEQNFALLTATQTNRAGAKAVTSSATDVAEDFNKIRIADIVIAINATEDEKRANEARLTWVASRNTEDGFSLQIRQDREKLKFLTKVLGRV